MIKKILLSGVKPTGRPHMGNYFGAMKPMVDLVSSGEYQAYIFIADIHALNFIQNKEEMQKGIYNLILDYLAIGLDPEKVVLFQQSEIPEHTELGWFLNTLVSTPFLMRGHSFKDAKAKDELEKFSVGDFTYPMLMAADILLYSPDVVPVGKDQKQHLEFARDFAQKFNNKFGEVFKLPEPVISEEVGTVIGTDGRKMSKSYKNTLPLFADENEIRETIRTIPMDSKLPEEKKNPEDYNLYKIFTLFANENEDAQLRQMFEEGGVGYGDIKKYVVDVIIDYTKEIREKRAELEKKPEYVLEVLKQGTENAKKVAQEKMEEIKTAIGFKL